MPYGLWMILFLSDLQNNAVSKQNETRLVEREQESKTFPIFKGRARSESGFQKSTYYFIEGQANGDDKEMDIINKKQGK